MKGVSIFPKNWKNFRDGFETSFLTKKMHQAVRGYPSQGGRQGLPAYY
jgi:hypothetical protein